MLSARSLKNTLRLFPAHVRAVSSLKEFASVNPDSLSGAYPHHVKNLVLGEWSLPARVEAIPDPLNGEIFLQVANTQEDELMPFIQGMRSCSKTGLHNPLRNVDRYLMLGRVSDKAGAALRTPEIADFFTRLIMRTSPKSYKQAAAEVTVTAQFLENFSGDQVRYLARSFANPGDHDGQVSRGYRFPYGPVAIISPFNFPLEIPVLQLMGALYMGNRPVLKVDSKVSVVAEQFLLLLQACGLPKGDVDFINSGGEVMRTLLMKGEPRMTQFTGSSRVAHRLCKDLAGKIKIEDAGFDWKLLGPDVSDLEYVAWQADQDAYACSGQKCSAQSMLIVHKAWTRAGLFDKMAELAARRKLEDLTIGPVLTWTTENMLAHVEKLLKIPGAKLLFGGKPLTGHTIPARYGAIEPTAVFVPLNQICMHRHYKLCTSEVFGPVQVVTEYMDRQLPKVLGMLERMQHHLTAAIVSRDEAFRQEVLASTVNGTTYSGIRARTTGAPQNHWFGPAGDPRGAGIGTREAIQMVWSCHREIIDDIGPIPADWTLPPPS